MPCNLGAWSVTDISFSEYVCKTCKAFFLYMHDLRQYLTNKSAVPAANALFYCSTIADHVELNANLGRPQALANVQEK